MPRFSTTEIVPFTAQQMFDLVADVESYPNFLPLCESLVVRSKGTSPEGLTQIVADMSVGYKAIRETFTSQVTLQPEALEILVQYVDGPFSHLHNSWRFEQSPETYAPGGSAVHFHIDYQFKSAMLGMLVGAMFDRAFRRFVIAFKERAAVVYGVGGGNSAVTSRAAF